MRYVKSVLGASAAFGVVALLVLNWRAQLDTHRKLDALTAALATRPADPPPAGPAAPPAHPRGPEYVIKPSDVLVVEAAVRDPATKVTLGLPKQPVSGWFPVRADGTVGLGIWGKVPVAGLTLAQATAAVREHLTGLGLVAEMPTGNLVVIVELQSTNAKPGSVE